jgi:hypothetical protein
MYIYIYIHVYIYTYIYIYTQVTNGLMDLAEDILQVFIDNLKNDDLDMDSQDNLNRLVSSF